MGYESTPKVMACATRIFWEEGQKVSDKAGFSARDVFLNQQGLCRSRRLTHSLKWGPMLSLVGF